MKSLINLICSSFKTLCCPFHIIILEDPLVELVQEIWGDAREDVAIRRILPE